MSGIGYVDVAGNATENPLLSTGHHIPFDRIEARHVVEAVRSALDYARALLTELKSSSGESYDDVIQALDDLVEWPSRVFGLVRHLNGVMNSAESRAAYNSVLPEYMSFMAGLTTDSELWAVIKRFAASPAAAALTPIKRRNLTKVVDEFRRGGADLPDADRRHAEQLRVELAQLSTKFSENVLDSTNAYSLVLTDAADLAGLPEGVRRRAKADAAARGVDGWRFTLQAPSYLPFMKYSERRELRRELHEAFFSVAQSGAHDNRPLVREILAKRRALANLLGYRNFADMQLEDRMMRNGDKAVAFENELARRTRPYFERENADLVEFARSALGLEDFQAWDLTFTTERIRRARFDFDDEALRPYFPLDGVLRGLFALVNTLFGVRIEPASDLATWHPDVQTYHVSHEDGTYLGSCYADWFPRESKRAGAWMNGLVTGGPVDDADGRRFEPHVGIIAANFTPPDGADQPLLTHDEVGTVFHEFGHLLHHIMARVEVRARSSLNVPWDFIELPSQIMENWTWERAALDLFARHHETGETIPDDLFARLEGSRTFLEAGAQMRQLSFGSADLALHVDYDPDSGDDPLAVAQAVMETLAYRPEFAQGRRMAAFSHVFAGGYAAGYYSYKWSEVLEADAFSRFKAEGIFNPATGREFADTILAKGDSRDADVMFRDFMGRDPDVDALILRNLGPAPTAA
ncbi:MAG TPA: M3 family metallopeptidase [Trueperaceae bacterium]|nr:M3 family metallopeptidase [Trueperaceae bacterium]